MDDDILDDIADEDIKIQKYLALNIPVVFSTTGNPYFKKIPHLSETSDNITINYSKRNNRHLTIKSFRHRLTNTLEDIKYDDYVNKVSFSSSVLQSGSLGYSELEIDSEDLDEFANNDDDDDYSDEDDEKDNIRMPNRRYHRYMDGCKKSPSTFNESPESLITPVNSKYTPSTKPQSNALPTEENIIKNIMETPEEQINLGDTGNTIEDNAVPEDEDYTYQEENLSDNNDQLSNDQLSNDEIEEEINGNNGENNDQLESTVEPPNEIEEEIVTKDNEEVTEQVTNKEEENTLSKNISSSNSSKNILRKTISGSKGSLQKLN